MSGAHLNLARKYRPKKFADVLGQEMVVKSLTQGLLLNRIAPAYLFSGPRGTGKTTCARLFAKAAACLDQDQSQKPCGKCSSCEAYDANKHMDLIEIDGASHTGVDDIRSIIESVAYRPSLGARSIYIIDEVHMLSNAAFNALLKTLEEPPPHALFLFATTEPEKIPDTILSRVQRIVLQKIKTPLIVSALQKICELESINSSEPLLQQIATSADGALRDAETLLEQAVLLSGGKNLNTDLVESFLGTIGQEQELELLKLISQSLIPSQRESSMEQCLQKLSQFYQEGKNLERLQLHLVQWIRGLLMARATGKPEILRDDYSSDLIHRALDFFKSWSLDDLDRLFEIFWLGLERLRRSDLPLITIETTFLRASRIVATEDLGKLIQALDSERIEPISNSRPAPTHQPAPSFTVPPAPIKSHEPPAALFASGSDKNARISSPNLPINSVEDLLKELKKIRPTLFALALSAEEKTWNENLITLRYSRGHFAHRQLSDKVALTELQRAVQMITHNTALQVSIIEAGEPQKSASNFMKEAQQVALEDPMVKRARELLGGKIESVVVAGIKTEIH